MKTLPSIEIIGAPGAPAMGLPFKVTWEYVTVEKAQAWLDSFNNRNRPMKKAASDSFARDMATNRWCPNHQGVAFAKEDGALIDGQNRLAAIVISGKGQWMLVFRDVPERIEGIEATVMETIDRGTPRSVADLLRLGHGMTQEANIVAAACVHVARLCVPHPEIQAKKASMPQTVGVLKIYKEEMTWVASERTSEKGLRIVALAGTMAFARAVLPEETASFYGEMKRRSGKAGSPAMVLREAILEDKFGLQGGSLWDRCRAAAVILEALRAHADGRKMLALPRPSECSEALEWFRKQQEARVLAVCALFPMLRTTESKPWPPAPEAREEEVGSRRSEVREQTAAPVTTTASTWRPTEAAQRLLAKARGK